MGYEYSAVPGTGRQSRCHFLLRCCKSPVVFYMLIVAISFGLGFGTRVVYEYLQIYSRLRGAAGHDTTVKHIKPHPHHHKLSAPTDAEQVASAAAIHRHSVGSSSTLQQHKKSNLTCSQCTLGLCNEPDPELFTEVSTELQVFLSIEVS